MGRIFVDGSNKNENTSSFAYENKHSQVEEVLLGEMGVVVEIITAERETVSIYTSDITKLIKALKAAYKHIEGKDINE